MKKDNIAHLKWLIKEMDRKYPMKVTGRASIEKDGERIIETTFTRDAKSRTYASAIDLSLEFLKETGQLEVPVPGGKFHLSERPEETEDAVDVSYRLAYYYDLESIKGPYFKDIREGIKYWNETVIRNRKLEKEKQLNI